MDVGAGLAGGQAGGRITRRVIALLVALAVLAERTASRSWPVRFVVLWILWRAEGLARDCVLAWTGAPVPWEPAVDNASTPLGAVPGGPDEALWLAARFRLLAVMLCMLLPDESRLDLGAGARAIAGAGDASGRGGYADAGTLEPHDTS